MSPKDIKPRLFSWLDLPGNAKPFGGQIVTDRLAALGHTVRHDNYLESDAVILLSMYWCEDIYNWVKFRHRHGLKNRQVIIGGNHATGSPRSLVSFCAGVYRGDADYWDGWSVDHIANISQAAVPCVSEILPRNKSIMETKAVAKVTLPLMEMSRGCKHKCKFCQYTWMKPYREQDCDWLLAQIKNSTGRIRLSSADIPQHKDFERILAACQSAGVQINNQDGSLLSTHKMGYTHLSKMQRFGVDGMSERIRLKMGKPIKTDFLVETIKQYSERGVRRCLAYNIFGFPGETRQDFLEWVNTLREIIDVVTTPFTFVNSWNAFLPMPLTPLGRSESSWHRDTRDFAIMAQIREYAKQKNVNIFDMPQKTSAITITRRLLAVRSTEQTAHIVRTWAIKPDTPEQAILKEFERCEGYHLHSQAPVDKLE